MSDPLDADIDMEHTQIPSADDEDELLASSDSGSEGTEHRDDTEDLLASSDSDSEGHDDAVDLDDDLDSSGDDDEESQLMKTYVEALARINANKFSYDDYVLLVNTAHAISDLEKIRQSCELFASVYPLAPEIWLKWLRIELNIATTEAEYKRVHQLFRRALADYYSTTVALEFANLVVKTPNMYETWEVLISTYTLDCMQGRSLFEAWRNHCKMNEPDGPEKYAKLVKMYEQELAIPLNGMEDTYIELKILCEKEKDKYAVDWEKLDAKYNKTKEQLAHCMIFEERLMALQPKDHQKRAAVYAEYIDAGKEFLNDQIVQILHERMVTECCLSAPSWLAYIEYIQRRDGVVTTTSHEEQLSLVFSQTDWDVCNRAIRNCTWSADLYIEKLRIAERMQLSREEVQGVAEFALAAGFQTPEPLVSIWMEYLTYLRRNIDFNNEKECQIFRATFELAWDTLGKQFGVLADCNCEILQMWGRLEYGPLCDLSKGKQLWTTVLESADNASKTGLWIEFAHLELRKGVDGARKVYRKSLSTPDLDDLSVITSAWIRFERCNGTLSQLKFAQRECEQRLEQQQIRNTFHARQKRKAPERGERQYGKPSANNGARKTGHASASSPDVRVSSDSKRKASDRGERQYGKPSANNGTRKTGGDNKHSDADGPSAAKRERLDVLAEEHDGHPVDTSNDNVTIFLSNLSYNTTEEDIKAAFPELNTKHVNIIKSANGNSRGFSYVQLASEDEVPLALSFDRRLINGRPTFISSVLRDKEQRKKFKYSDEMEPTKLFVKGLNFETTKDQLETVFGEFGALKDVRMVCHKNGKSKGIAYVEFVDEKSASTAILKLDQTELSGFKISVAISAPPVKPQANRGTVGAQLTLGQGRRNQTSKGEAKPRLSFIPRVVLKNNAQTDQKPAAPSTTVPTDKAGEVLKTNDDFRRFLTQSK